MPIEIRTVHEAAALLGVSSSWLSRQLLARRFAGVKIAGRWRMTDEQIGAAIESMTSPALPAEPPSPAGLTRNSRFKRRMTTKVSA